MSGRDKFSELSLISIRKEHQIYLPASNSCFTKPVAASLFNVPK